MTDHVFAEFCAAGLWPGAGKALLQAFPDAGIHSARDVTQARLRTLPRVTDTRAARLFTAWIGAGQAYALAELLIPEEIPARWVSRLIDALGDSAADRPAQRPVAAAGAAGRRRWARPTGWPGPSSPVCAVTTRAGAGR